jgi:hypothetical protein
MEETKHVLDTQLYELKSRLTNVAAEGTSVLNDHGSNIRHMQAENRVLDSSAGIR